MTPQFVSISGQFLHGYASAVGDYRAEVVQVDSCCGTWHCFTYYKGQMVHHPKAPDVSKSEAMAQAKRYLKGVEIVYVIIKTGDNGRVQYVAPPGQEKSYTYDLTLAWTFTDKGKAEAQRCPENERVVPVESLLRPPQ